MKLPKTPGHLRRIVFLIVLCATIIIVVSIMRTMQTQNALKGVNVLEIQPLNSEIQRLKGKIDSWNFWNIVFLVLTFMAAGGLEAVSKLGAKPEL